MNGPYEATSIFSPSLYKWMKGGGIYPELAFQLRDIRRGEEEEEKKKKMKKKKKGGEKRREEERRGEKTREDEKAQEIKYMRESIWGRHSLVPSQRRQKKKQRKSKSGR